MFAWDEDNREHIARHAVTPEEAEEVIQNEPLDIERQLQNGARRMLHLGETARGRFYTWLWRFGPGYCGW